MSKTSEKYIIERLERTENRLKWSEENRNNALEELRKTQEKLRVLVHRFEKTTSENGEYAWYKLKDGLLINAKEEAFKIIEEQLDEEIPF